MNILPTLAKDGEKVANKRRNAQRLALTTHKLLKKARIIEPYKQVALGLPKSVKSEIIALCETYSNEYECTGASGAVTSNFEIEIERGNMTYFVDVEVTFTYERDDSDVYGPYCHSEITDLQVECEVLDKETDTLYPKIKERIDV